MTLKGRRVVKPQHNQSFSAIYIGLSASVEHLPMD